MFVSCIGEDTIFGKGFTLILPAISVGQVGQLAVDLVLNNLPDIQKCGYFYDDCFLPVVGIDPFSQTLGSGKICTCTEVFQCHSKKLVIVQQRAPFIKGRIPSFRKKLLKWAKSCQFERVILLSSCSSHVRRDEQITGSSFRYLLSTSLTSQEESFQKSFEWTKFDNRRQDILSEDSEEDIFIPGGGIAKSLYDDCCSNDVPLAVLLVFSNEGNSVSDAIQLVNNLNRWLELSSPGNENEKESMKGVWKIPHSWRMLQAYSGPISVF